MTEEEQHLANEYKYNGFRYEFRAKSGKYNDFNSYVPQSPGYYPYPKKNDSKEEENKRDVMPEDFVSPLPFMNF
jgi:hypothetical protein